MTSAVLETADRTPEGTHRSDASSPTHALGTPVAGRVDEHTLEQVTQPSDQHPTTLSPAGLHIRALPDAYASMTSWRSASHWVDVVVEAAITQRPHELAAVKVSPETFRRWAAAIARFAHTRTGHGCVATPDRLAALLGVTKRTVQRCQAAARALGLYVVVMEGRRLTRDEALTARRMGSRQRGLANEAALVVPEWLPKAQAWGRRGSASASSRRRRDVTPPRKGYRYPSHLTVSSSLRHDAAATSGGSQGGAPRGKRDRARPARPAIGVAAELVLLLPWLSRTAPGRIEPMLRRFAASGWSAGDLYALLEDQDRRCARASMTGSLVRSPVGLLASRLRGVDEHDPELVGLRRGRPAPRSERGRESLRTLELARQRRAEATASGRRLAPGTLDARLDSRTQEAQGALAAMRDAVRAAREQKEARGL